MLTECVRYKELKSRSRNSKSADTESRLWARFAGIAADGASLKKKTCGPPILKASGVWGPEKIQHYKFTECGWKFCKLLGNVASNTPEWDEASVKINQVTLAKKCCRDSVNPISQTHLKILQEWKGRTDHELKGCTLKYQPVLKSDLPAAYALDKYGLVVFRKFADPAQPPEEFETSDNIASDKDVATEATTLFGTTATAEVSCLSRPIPLNDQTSSGSNISSPITLPSLPTTQPPSPTQSPETAEAHSSSGLITKPLQHLDTSDRRTSNRLRTMPVPSYKAPTTCTKRARPKAQRPHSRCQVDVPNVDPNGCTCSDKVPRGFLSAIENPQHIRSEADTALAMNYDTENYTLCVKHLTMYARWATTGILLPQRSKDHLLHPLPKRLASDFEDASWSPTISSKRRRLSLPGTYSHSYKSTIMAGSNDEIAPRFPAMQKAATELTIQRPATDHLSDYANRISFDEFRKRYLENLREAIDKSKRDVQQTVKKFVHLADDSRLRIELPRYYNILDSVVLPKLLSYAEYIALTEPPHGAVLLATMEQAALVLRKGPLRIPVFIPSQFRQESFCEESIHTFLQDSHMGQWIMVQDYAKPIGEGDVRSIPKTEFMKTFLDSQHYPINCLDLAGSTLNPNPLCYLGVPSLHLLAKVASGGHGGKLHYIRNTDLAASQSFNLLGKAGAWSMPHIDRTGVLSSVEGIVGNKLWLKWPGLSIAQLERWDESAADVPHDYQEASCSSLDKHAFADWQQRYALAPCISPIATLIGRQDLFLQPSGMLHSPYSITDVLMHGTMHWDSRDIGRIMEFSMLETAHRTVTNEDQPNDFYHLMQRSIYKMMEDKEGVSCFQWPDDAMKVKTCRLFEVCSASL
jgi:hypothetical protein